MKVLYLILITLLISVACSEEKNENLNDMDAIKSEPHIAKVIDKIEVKNYNYLQVSENKEEYWIAVPTIPIEVGETVYFSKYTVMSDFKSSTIDRTFDEILFVDDARKSPTPNEMKKIHTDALTLDKEKVKVEPASDGKTIEQIFSQKSELKGQMVKVRGKVVKFNKQIMKRNWIHIQDGTGTEKDYDLVLTSNDDVKVGDVITAEGKLAVDKDFGSGYFFPVIIEEAKIEKD
ncbi:MAG: GW dipeptide domain-containing protein [Ignavibacteriaceae bacterium]